MKYSVVAASGLVLALSGAGGAYAGCSSSQSQSLYNNSYGTCVQAGGSRLQCTQQARATTDSACNARGSGVNPYESYRERMLSDNPPYENRNPPARERDAFEPSAADSLEEAYPGRSSWSSDEGSYLGGYVENPPWVSGLGLNGVGEPPEQDTFEALTPPDFDPGYRDKRNPEARDYDLIPRSRDERIREATDQRGYRLGGALESEDRYQAYDLEALNVGRGDLDYDEFRLGGGHHEAYEEPLPLDSEALKNAHRLESGWLDGSTSEGVLSDDRILDGVRYDPSSGSPGMASITEKTVTGEAAASGQTGADAWGLNSPRPPAKVSELRLRFSSEAQIRAQISMPFERRRGEPGCPL